MFKTPKINSDNKKYFVIAHYFELFGIFGIGLLLIMVLLLNQNLYKFKIYLLLPITIILIGYIELLSILEFVSITKNEILRARYPANPTISTINFFAGVNKNTYKNSRTLSLFYGILNIILILFLIFFYILISKSLLQ